MLSAPLAVATATSAAVQLGSLAVIALLYARRARTLAAEKHPVAGRHQTCFYGGIILLAAALISLNGRSQDLLWVNMIEQLLLGDLAALLIALGLTEPLLEPLLQIRPFDRLRALSHPAIAFALWMIDLYIWHLPIFYEAALQHSGVQALQHAMFLGFGVNMWICLVGPLPSPRWFDNHARLIYIVAVRLAGAALANVFLWSSKIYYPYFLTGEARFHISPLADQSIAGAIMMVEESVFTLSLFYWLFRRTVREREERHELLDFASRSGLELSSTRVASAVSAGRGAELRRRLQAQLDAAGNLTSALHDRGDGDGADAPLQAHSGSTDRR